MGFFLRTEIALIHTPNNLVLIMTLQNGAHNSEPQEGLCNLLLQIPDPLEESQQSLMPLGNPSAPGASLLRHLSFALFCFPVTTVQQGYPFSCCLTLYRSPEAKKGKRVPLGFPIRGTPISGRERARGLRRHASQENQSPLPLHACREEQFSLLVVRQEQKDE